MTEVLSIGVLVPEFPSQTHTFFWREIQAVRQAGVAVHLVSTRRPLATACRHEFADEARRATHYLFPPSPTSLLALAARPWRTLAGLAYVAGLRESSWRAKLRYLGLMPCAAGLVRHARRCGYRHVHVHSCADAAHLVALGRVLGGPTYSLTLHGDLAVYGVDHRSKMARALFVACVARPHMEQVVRDVGLPRDRVEVLHMGVEPDRYPPAPVRDREPGRLHLVTVARLDPCKGHRFALEALRVALDQMCDLRYSIAGGGAARPQIESEIARLGLGDRVTLLGTLGEQEVRDLLVAADAFVLPSVGMGEAAPVAVMEAMAAGLPVVSTIIGGTPDMITDGEDGLLVPQSDIGGLAAAFKRLAWDVALRERLGRAAAGRARCQFDSRQLAGRLLGRIAAARSESGG